MITKRLSVKWILIWSIGTIGLMGLFYLGVARGGDIATMVMVLLLVVLLPSFFLSGVFLHEGNRQARIRRLRKTVSKEYIQAMSAKQVLVGMTEQMVRLAWENPKRIETSADGGSEIWVYSQPRQIDRRVWLTEGRVTQIEA